MQERNSRKGKHYPKQSYSPNKRGMYRIEIANAVKSDIRKLDKRLQRIIRDEHFANIEKDPFEAVPFLYEFKGLWSYHLSHKGTQYRIVYEICSEGRIVQVIMVGSREGFYQTLRRRTR